MDCGLDASNVFGVGTLESKFSDVDFSPMQLSVQIDSVTWSVCVVRLSQPHESVAVVCVRN